MDEYEKIDEAIEYVQWLIKNLDQTEDGYLNARHSLTTVLGYLVVLKGR